MTEFIPGQRVVYTALSKELPQREFLGWTGTVVKQEDDRNVKVTWDNGKSYPSGVLPANIAPITNSINEENTVTQFKKGMRVLIEKKLPGVWNDDTMSKTIGKMGTVDEPLTSNSSYVRVRVDDNLGTWSYETGSLKVVEVIVVGSRIKYVGNTLSLAMSKESIGRTGTVKSLDKSYDGSATCGIVWDDGRSANSAPYMRNLQLLVTPSDAEIAAALAVLGNAGTVTFKPTKPAFVDVKVYISSSYTANVSSKSIQVGCTNISFETFDKVAEAVAAARAYNKD